MLGVECSNHSVPTIFFNDLAQPNPLGFFMPKKGPYLDPYQQETCACYCSRQSGLEV